MLATTVVYTLWGKLKVSVFVWDLDPMLDRVLEAELPQDVASVGAIHYVHLNDGNEVGVGLRTKLSSRG